jgi:hypothetical protein
MRYINRGRKVPTGWVTFCFGWDIKPRAYCTLRVGIISSLSLAKLIYITGCPRRVFCFNRQNTCDIWCCHSGECETAVLWCIMSRNLIGVCWCLGGICPVPSSDYTSDSVLKNENFVPSRRQWIPVVTSRTTEVFRSITIPRNWNGSSTFIDGTWLQEMWSRLQLLMEGNNARR